MRMRERDQGEGERDRDTERDREREREGKKGRERGVYTNVQGYTWLTWVAVSGQ